MEITFKTGLSDVAAQLVRKKEKEKVRRRPLAYHIGFIANATLDFLLGAHPKNRRLSRRRSGSSIWPSAARSVRRGARYARVCGICRAVLRLRGHRLITSTSPLTALGTTAGATSSTEEGATSDEEASSAAESADDKPRSKADLKAERERQRAELELLMMDESEHAAKVRGLLYQAWTLFSRTHPGPLHCVRGNIMFAAL